MRTVTGQGQGAKGLGVIGVAVTALAVGAWILPSGAQMERAPVGAVHTPAEIAPDVNTDSDLDVWISFPATLQEGQYCVAYAVAWGGTPPYEFEWWGYLSNGNAWDGPLGPNQIAGAYFSEDGYLGVTVDDSDGNSDHFVVTFETGDEYNPDCEG